MPATAEKFQLPFRLIVVLYQDKVLYAKVSGDFVDVLLSFLTLPLGTIVRILARKYGHEAPILGSLSSLYKGLEELAIDNFYWEAGKRLLLKPRNSFEARCRQLKVNIDDTAPIRYFICRNWDCTEHPKYVSLYYGNVACYYCRSPIDSEVRVEDSNVDTPSGGGVFVTSRAQSFIVADDLRIFPYLPEYVLQILQDFGADTVGLQERDVDFGYLQMMKLLKFSLVSKNPLTDTILNGRNMNQEPVSFVPQMVRSDLISRRSEKMSVTAFVQKSTNRILSVQAGKDFVEFLFSLLTIPLGKAENLLLGNTCLGSMDNLYISVRNLIRGKHIFTPRHSTNSLLDPQLPPNYVSAGQILPLTQQSPHVLLSNYDLTQHSRYEILRINRGLTFEFTMSTSRNINGRSIHVGSNFSLDLMDLPPKRSLYHRKLHSSSQRPGAVVRMPLRLEIQPFCRNYYECPMRTIDPKGLRPIEFMVTDDLVVTPACDFNIYMLQQIGIPINDIETHVLDVGMKEALDILKASLTSSFALTNGLKQCLNREDMGESEVTKFTRHRLEPTKQHLGVGRSSEVIKFTRCSKRNRIESPRQHLDVGRSSIVSIFRKALLVARSVSNRQISIGDIILALSVLALSAFIFYAILPTKKSPSYKG